MDAFWSDISEMLCSTLNGCIEDKRMMGLKAVNDELGKVDGRGAS
jgi:hypothetical protein